MATISGSRQQGYKSGKHLWSVPLDTSPLDTKLLTNRLGANLLRLFGITTDRKYPVGPDQLEDTQKNRATPTANSLSKGFQGPGLPHTGLAPTISNAA